MEDLEKKLSSLPQAKLSRRADWKIKFSLYRLMFLAYLQNYSFSWKTMPFRQRGLSFAVLFLILFGTTSVYAYASDKVVPGNPLYNLKLVVEKVEKVAAITPAAEFTFNEKLSDRRLKEAVNLSRAKVNASPVASEKISKKIENNITAAINNHQAALDARKISDDNHRNQATSTDIYLKDQEQENYLNQIESFAQTSQDQAILDKIGEAHQAMSKFNNNHNTKIEKDTSNDDSLNKINQKRDHNQNKIDNSNSEDLNQESPTKLNENSDIKNSNSINSDTENKEVGDHNRNND